MANQELDRSERLNGQFVAVCAGESLVIGPFESYADAIKAGREHCGSDSFVVMRLQPAKRAEPR